MDREQTEGRKANGAAPGDKPEPTTPDSAVRKVGKAETRSAGPDGPDATTVGDTFKSTGGPDR